MNIGNSEYKEIIVQDNDGGVLVVITDNEIIEHDDVKVVCMPAND